MLPPDPKYFIHTQAEWINDDSPAKMLEKSRQVGATKTGAIDSVMKASPGGAKFDVWVTSRDEFQAMLYLEDCKEAAGILAAILDKFGCVIVFPLCLTAMIESV